MFVNKKIPFFTILAFVLGLTPHSVNAQIDNDRYTALVEQTEISNSLPKPVLLQMINEGVNLEDAAAVTVRNSISSDYAEAYTYYAICMSINDSQAEDVHDIVVSSARESLRASVIAEAHYALEHFLVNRCDGLERLTRSAPEESLTTENTVGGRASVSL